MRKESYFVLRFTTPTTKGKKGQPVTISNDYITKVYKSLLDWLCNNGYQFNSNLHKGVYMKVYTPSELRKMTNIKEMHLMPNGNYFAIDRDVPNCSRFITKMLTAYGCTNITLKDTVLERDWIYENDNHLRQKIHEKVIKLEKAEASLSNAYKDWSKKRKR